MFNAGEYKDINRVGIDDLGIEFMSPELTIGAMEHVAITNSMFPASPMPDATHITSAMEAGFVQLRDHQLESRIILIGTDHNSAFLRDPFKNMRYGVPYGIGDEVQKRHKEAIADPAIAPVITKDPKAELQRILLLEANDPTAHVGPPFTVLHMKLDGTIEDVSNNAVCRHPHGIPLDSDPK
jgi:hypothetical protein